MCPLHQHTAYIVGTFGFFIFGLLNSLHCVGMCGPLSTLFTMKGSNKFLPFILYHAGRVISYSLAGFFLAWIGVTLQNKIPFAVSPWVLIVILGSYLVFGGLKPPAFLAETHRKLFKNLPQSANRRGLGLGLLTIFIPCGLLYVSLASSLMAPSPLMGSLWMFSFAMGTIPLLALGQWGIKLISKKISPASLQWLLKICAIISMAFILWMSFVG